MIVQEYVPSCFRNVLDSMSIDDLNWFNQQNGKGEWSCLALQV